MRKGTNKQAKTQILEKPNAEKLAFMLNRIQIQPRMQKSGIVYLGVAGTLYAQVGAVLNKLHLLPAQQCEGQEVKDK